MAVKHRSAVKLSRKLGVALTPKAARIMAKKAAGPRRRGAPGGRAPGGRGRMSDYKVRFLEKQKLRAQYDIREQPLRNYFEKARGRASIQKLNMSEALIQLLERRLDAVTLRGGLAVTIYAARQLVSHGHILVNGKRVDAPSCLVEIGDVVSVKPKSLTLPVIVETVESAQPPLYLELDKEKRSVRLTRLPQRDEVPVICDMAMVVEFYSR